jgi:hypothetical protein
MDPRTNLKPCVYFPPSLILLQISDTVRSSSSVTRSDTLRWLLWVPLRPLPRPNAVASGPYIAFCRSTSRSSLTPGSAAAVRPVGHCAPPTLRVSNSIMASSEGAPRPASANAYCSCACRQRLRAPRRLQVVPVSDTVQLTPSSIQSRYARRLAPIYVTSDPD